MDATERIASLARMHEQLLEAIDRTALMLRGMTMDPAIPSHAKEAMRLKIADLEKLVEKHTS